MVLVNEFVVASPDVLDERVASDDNGGGSVAFESANWAKTCPQLTVIALGPIVRVRLARLLSGSVRIVDPVRFSKPPLNTVSVTGWLNGRERLQRAGVTLLV